MARISLDNGNTFYAGEEVSELYLAKYWDVIVEFMDDDIQKQVHDELAPCTEADFLRRYLELAEEDLIVG